MVLKKDLPKWNHMSITINFKDTVILAIIKLFSGAKIHGCNFQWNQCLSRNVQEKRLATDHEDNKEVRLLIRMCPHLPVENMDDGWLVIQVETPNNNKKLKKFSNYYITQ